MDAECKVWSLSELDAEAYDRMDCKTCDRWTSNTDCDETAPRDMPRRCWRPIGVVFIWDEREV